MSRLIQMRQRIAAVETIRKVTHAMRLISMSMHTRLRGKIKFIHNYKTEFTKLFARVQQSSKNWTHSLLSPDAKTDNNPLIILIGSQKGLCGNFNTAIWAYCEQDLAHTNRKNAQVITVGKKAYEYAKIGYGTIIMHFDEFSYLNLLTIADKIANHILQAAKPYTSVTVYSNYPKTFFLQKPITTTLIPFSYEHIKTDKEVIEDYNWEQPPEFVLDFLANRLIHVTLQEVLFQSLIAEQAARFIAMDSSTRNAGNLLETMHLNYNKLRQSSITRELTDLAASF